MPQYTFKTPCVSFYQFQIGGADASQGDADEGVIGWGYRLGIIRVVMETAVCQNKGLHRYY
jgi:hypothetical protein